MQEINSALANNEIAETLYYKKLQKELRDKKLKANKNKNTTETKDKSHQPQKIKTHSKIINSDEFKDKIHLTNQELEETITKKENIQQKNTKKLTEKLKFNGHEIMKHLRYKINFFERKNEFKEMYKYNLQQSRSANTFTSKFAQFKVGVISQILSAIDIPIKELKQLHNQAITELFNQNNMEMKENIYNTELTEILYGQSKKTKRKTKLFIEIQKQLIKQMNKIGRIGFWSKTKLFEEKIMQCKKIKEEFTEEKQHLTYLLSYINQKKIS